MSERFFPYAVDRRYAPVLVLFGVVGARDGVRLSESELIATFGFFTVRTSLANVKDAHITRNYRWWTAVGARRSMVDDGLTFGTNREAGVCIHFHAPVPSPLKRSGHSALTVTVRDLDELVTAIGGTAAPS